MPSKLDKHKIESALLKYCQEQIFDASFQLEAEDALADTGIDSHNLLDLVMFLEREFGIVLPDSELTAENLRSVASIASCAVNIEQG